MKGWQKPQLLISQLIRQHMHSPDSWILDAMCGTGTTSVCALKLGMHAMAFDINKETATAALKRLSTMTDPDKFIGPEQETYSVQAWKDKLLAAEKGKNSAGVSAAQLTQALLTASKLASTTVEQASTSTPIQTFETFLQKPTEDLDEVLETDEERLHRNTVEERLAKNFDDFLSQHARTVPSENRSIRMRDRLASLDGPGGSLAGSLSGDELRAYIEKNHEPGWNSGMTQKVQKVSDVDLEQFFFLFDSFRNDLKWM